MAIRVFDGTTSVMTADPPMPALSTTVTSAPSCAAASAASYPPGPPPRIAMLCVRSKEIDMPPFFPSGVSQGDTPAPGSLAARTPSAGGRDRPRLAPGRACS